MRRAEALEAQIGELQGEVRALLDEYVEVQQRLHTLESVTGRSGERAGERAVADLPKRLRQVAAATRTGPDSGDRPSNWTERTTTRYASQAEVAAAVARAEQGAVETTGEEVADADTEMASDLAQDGTDTGGDEGADDIIVG